MLAVIDYGAGNLRSVMHALKHLSAENVKLVREPKDLEGAQKIILPGVGAFGASMQQMHKQGLVEPVREAVKSGIPYLGICVGMQMMFDYSDEMGTHEGIGLMKGYVTRFPSDMGLKVPHIGWNVLEPCFASPLIKDLPAESYGYFVHSYYCVPADSADTLVATDYGIRFAAAVQHENLYGVQFHPEKSQRMGLQILRNFLEI
jgi:imidazole glycerol-phosphate synthase subunit HisH